MYLRITPDGPVPYSVTDLRRANPQTCFPAQPDDADLAKFGVYRLTSTPPPVVDAATQVVDEGPPALIGGFWTQQWTVRDLTPTELFDRIPKSISALQGMRAIKAAGLVPAFLAWKATLDPVEDFETLAFLDKAQTWVWDDPTLNTALAQLGMQEQKAALFTLAGTL